MPPTSEGSKRPESEHGCMPEGIGRSQSEGPAHRSEGELSEKAQRAAER
ncbi:unnamed protein product [marine sediment metagenome]|uniref:Uncharacterized protein n=1 Tax=marine sediment metagenome TaxID=412755 RepID=X1JXY1_9ZZZZ